MSFLQWFLNFLGVAICSQILPAKAYLNDRFDGDQIVHIYIGDDKKEKHITLQKLSDKFIMEFKSKHVGTEIDYSKGVKVPLDFELPYSPPVLDQGQYGTCVTFATTSAMEAALKWCDVISQQCTLEYLAGKGINLWNGASYSSEIIEPLKEAGVVSNSKCPNAYPKSYAYLTADMYKKLVDRNVSSIQYLYYPSISILDVKNAIRNGHYVTLGIGLMNTGDAVSVQGYDVKVGGKKYSGGLWACKQGLSFTSYCGVPKGGHEIVVYGFDDTQKLLKIRNSWSYKAGYMGDFYMTYEFFEAMVMDGTEIY